MEYRIKRSKRAKYMRLTIQSPTEIVLTLPRRATVEEAKQFAEEKSAWVQRHIARLQKQKYSIHGLTRCGSYITHKEKARAFVKERIAYFNNKKVFPIGRISIRNQRTCWGSCSARRNLSFNYRIVFLPPALQDYLIVHELCHLKELNHSSRFWKLVESILPDYKLRKAMLH